MRSLKISFILRSALFISIYYISFTFSLCLAAENLDELEARSYRRASNTIYIGTDSAPEYYWQPQTLCYIDIGTGHEVWKISNMPEGEFGSNSEEYGQWSSWSADGAQ